MVSAGLGIAQKGNYFLHNYLPAQYSASDQNRCILQDTYGRIFVANNDGVLINNGSEWEIRKLPFLCLSLAKDENEEVFIAGDGHFGKLSQYKNGNYKFVGLDTLLPEKERDLGKFWTIITLKGHVYFCSNQKILDYNYKTVRSILPGDEGFHTFFKVEDHLITREKGKGLKILSVNNEFTLVKGGEIFADNDNPVRGIIKGDKCHYIVTPQGIYEFDFNKSLPELTTLKKINTPIDKWLNEKTVYCASNIGNNNFAFGSVNGGVVITDKKFNAVKYINADNELQDDGVNYIYNDNQGHIWLALAKGISLIEFNSPITKFTKTDGIIGTIEACIFYNHTPFLATDKGILKYNAATLKFEQTNITEAAWCLTEANGELLAGTKTGVYILDKGTFKLIYETPGAAHCIFNHPTINNLIYVGTEIGYATGNLKNKTFTPLNEFFELGSDIRFIVSDKDHYIYFCSSDNGLYVKAPDSDSLQHLDPLKNYPSLEYNSLFQYGNDVQITTDTGFFQIRRIEKNFEITPNPEYSFFANRYAIINAISVNGNVWLTAKSKFDSKGTEMILCLEKKNNVFAIKPMQLSRIKESNTKSFCYNDSLVYIGTNNGLYCYDVNLEHNRFGLNTFVNSILFGKDSSNYFYNIHPQTILDPIQLKYINNSVEIKLGASDYIDKNALLFSYYLQGRDTAYGAFVSNKIIKYDYLYEGDYVFHVRSKNILGVEGQEIKISFTVLPPWYRTIWAYSIYVLVFLGLVALIIKLYSKRLIEQNLKLENIITERTKEINTQKLEIEHKNQEITDSINYAKGIQDSILPSLNEIKKVWADLFIFFQPKDIVSGDFYWFKPLNADEFLIAAADCTGHGVPGGFMSMICSDKLHDAARETKIPSDILFKANNSIKETLRQQNEGKSKDGMEICLIKVNIKTREVLYSGANRQLWIIDSKTNELSEIKPTKASIASFTAFNFKYELNTLQLNKGDILFITSDGYPDQFGGPNGKKYMSKTFKNFLVANSNLPFQQQERRIKENINTWMSGYEQVDDLLVIGIKL